MSVYALVVSWAEGDELAPPELVVGESPQMARRGGFAVLRGRMNTGEITLSETLLSAYPVPESRAHDDDVLRWLQVFQAAVPSVLLTLYVFSSNGWYGRGEVIPLDT